MRIVAVIICLGLFVACERDPVDSGPGEQTSPTEINKAQERSLAKLDPYEIKQGQTVHFTETQELISSQAPIKVLSKEWLTEVKLIENQPEERILTNYKTVTDRLWDKDFVYVFKGVYYLEQVESLELLDQLDQNRYSMTSILHQLQEQGRVEETEIEGVAFHNLKEQSVTIVPPDLVKNAKNCKGIKGCRLQGDRITYDVVFLLKGGGTQTHNVEWLISPDVPYFAAILKQCSTTIVPVDNQRVLVKQCNEVVDFNE